MLLLVPVITFLNKLLIVWGLLLIVINSYKLLVSKRKLFFEIALYAFLVITFILTIFKYPTVDNLKSWLINTMLFTVIFFVDTIWFAETINDKVIDYNFTTLFANENALGIASILSFVVSLYLLFSTKLSSGRLFNIANCLVQLSAMFLSPCRSSYLVIISLVFVYMYVYIKNNYARLAMLLIPLTSLFILLRFFFEKLGVILSGREDYWRISLGLIKSYPLVGVGNTNLVPMVVEGNPTWPYSLYTGGLHNIYIQIATVNGLISLALLLLFMFFAFLFLVKKLSNFNNKDKLKYTALLGLLVGISLVNLLESTLFYTVSFKGLLFGIYSGYLIYIFHTNKNIY